MKTHKTIYLNTENITAFPPILISHLISILAIRESQRYFIPPVSTLLLLSFTVMAAAFFGFQKLKTRGVIVNTNDEAINNNSYNEDIFEEVKKE